MAFQKFIPVSRAFVPKRAPTATINKSGVLTFNSAARLEYEALKRDAKVDVYFDPETRQIGIHVNEGGLFPVRQNNSQTPTIAIAGFRRQHNLPEITHRYAISKRDDGMLALTPQPGDPQ